MISALKPYPLMKDSGVPWLEAVPEHWEVRRLKYLLCERDVRSADGTEQLLRVSQYTGVTERKRTDGLDEPDTRAESLLGYKCVKPDELVINIMLAWNGSMGVSRYSGIVSPAYCVYRLGASTHPWFFHYSLRSPTYKARIKGVSTGVVDSRLRLYTDDLYRLEGLLPPLSEQTAIVRYLDYMDRRIRRFIRAKQKLIKLLEEQKQSIIHQAVTRGLDPNVRFKPSGTKWLGDVPEHWEVRQAKYFYREVDDRSETGDEELLSVSHITGVTPRSQKNITMFMASSYAGHKVCKPSDLVINTMWAWMAALGVARQTGIVSPSYGVYRPLRPTELLGDYADLLLRTKPYVSEYVCRSTGIRSSRLRLYPEQFLRIALACPPVNEQRVILKYLLTETGEIEQAIAGAQREIELLREYRTRLIADVVTGKLDVREAAARLPDEVEEPELIDEAETLTDDNEISEVTDQDDLIEETGG